MPKILTRKDYMSAAEKKDLVLTDPLTPKNINQRTSWRCVHCGTESIKSLRAVRQAPHGCECQSDRTLDFEKYHLLASRLEIEWVSRPGRYPKNNKAMTTWRGTNGTIVEASYHELYRLNRIPKRLIQALGLSGDVLCQDSNKELLAE